MDNNQPPTMTQFVEDYYRHRPKDAIYLLQRQLAQEADADERLIQVLFSDTRRAMQESTVTEGDQFKYRTVVRTLFAHIEGELAIKKRQIVRWYRIGGMQLTESELKKLIDEPTTFPEISPSPLKPKWQKLQKNLLFTFAKFRRLPGIPQVDIDTTSNGWKALLDAIKIRNDFTHPKTDTDLLVTPEGMLRVIQAWNWYAELSARINDISPISDEVLETIRSATMRENRPSR